MPRRELVLHPLASQRMTLEALARAADLHAAMVERCCDYGLLEPVRTEEHVVWFDASAVPRLRTIRRLREDLGINLAGIAVVLDLLQRIEDLKRERAGPGAGTQRSKTNSTQWSGE